jgi:glucoamylase
VVAVAAVALVLVSGGSDADPRTPAALPGLPPPFLGTAVTGGGETTAAIDAYGDVVDLRAEPAGAAFIDNPSSRQSAGTVAADTGIVPRVSVDGGAGMPFWQADSVSQRYLPGTNVVRTVARFGRVRAIVTDAAHRSSFARLIQVRAPEDVQVRLGIGVNVEPGMACRRGWSGRTLALTCAPGLNYSGGGSNARDDGPRIVEEAQSLIAQATRADRKWLHDGTTLGPGAPSWARRMDARSQLTLRALSVPRTGAVAAGARDGWAYVWPRDAATAALALEAAGHPGRARRATRFLLGLNPEKAARFRGDGRAVPGRGPQGDAAGWIAAAAHATGLALPNEEYRWRNRPDYQEGSGGEYLGNAIAATTADLFELEPPYRGSKVHQSQEAARGGKQIARSFGTSDGLVRRSGDPGSGLDSAAAWAVRPFGLPVLFPAVRRTLLHLTADQTQFGIVPGEGWSGGDDPWMAPTAWTAWALAALARSAATPAAARVDRRQALHLLGDLRRAATPAGALPERVDAETGVPRSTTPLAWPHAFAILALRELWPSLRGSLEERKHDR